MKTSGDICAFITFHKTLYEDHYSDLNRYLDCVNFIAVNKSIDKSVPSHLHTRVINEWDFDIYDESLQNCGYDENSTFYHVYANKLYEGYDYLGFFQFDMTLTDNLFDEILKDPQASKKVFYQSMWLQHFRRGNPLAFYLLKNYNEYFGTDFHPRILKGEKPYVLCASFVVHKNLYLKIAPWICQLIKDKDLYTAVQVITGQKKRMARELWIGNILERAYSLAFFLDNDIDFVKLDSSHFQTGTKQATHLGAQQRYSSESRLAEVLLRFTKTSPDSVGQYIVSVFLLCFQQLVARYISARQKIHLLLSWRRNSKESSQASPELPFLRKAYLHMFDWAKKRGFLKQTLSSKDCRDFS